jgi:cytochrome P450
MVAALEAYFVARHDLSVSDDMDEVEQAARMTLDTVELERQHGFTATEIAATYVTIIHGALVNVVPTIFWTVAWVFSRPSLLARLREELLASISIPDTAGMKSASEISLDLAILESACPLLLSVFRETQRLAAVGTLHRRVLEDTIVFDDQSDQDNLGSSFLLKKGTSILIPVTNNQRDERVWGSTADDYDPDRFMRHRPHGFAQHTQFEEKRTAKGERLRKQAYYPFGGGKELCPGRSFATLEAVGTTAMLVLGFDIRAKDGGIFKAPHFGPSKMTAATARPHADCDLGISLSRREGWENVVWTVKST